MKNLIFLLILIIGVAGCCHKKKLIKIACIGDSITEGAGVKSQSKSSYPAQLDSILGKNSHVLNCGRGGATLLKNGDLPIWVCNQFHNVFVYRPDVIVIKLGTNDTKPQNWNRENFEKDYQAMIDTFNTISSHPRIFLCLPVPSYKVVYGINDSTLTSGVIPAIQKIALANHLPVIDLYKPLSNHNEFFPDNIHPNEEGAKVIAETVAKEIKSVLNSD